MLAVRPKDKHILLAATFLASRQRDRAWGNTKATAMAVYALARYAAAAGEINPDQTVEVLVDGQGKSFRITGKNVPAFGGRLEVPPDRLPPGRHTVTITRRGRGSVYWAADLHFRDKGERLGALGRGLAVRRTYYRLTPERFQNTRWVWRGWERARQTFSDVRYKREKLGFGAQVASGDLIEAELDIRADAELEYVLIEDPRPAGCEPVESHSTEAWDRSSNFRVEFRDTKTAFFTGWLPSGRRTLTHRMRCEQPGGFRVLPARAAAMYVPAVQASSDSGKIVITTRPEKASR